ncbi:hypothetical protein [Sulfurimonas sp.]|uniref:hypothetical protein n=1 Tax=Sulfurimonas sp. TaxID=2022749 RepID=UPI0025FB5E70|nr:hypothetical protein [Sulfurimonas sp.]
MIYFNRLKEGKNKMKKSIFLILAVMVLGTGANAKFCDKSNEVNFLSKKDNFGNTSKKEVSGDKAAIQLYIRGVKKSEKKLKDTSIYFGEIVGNFLVKHPKNLKKRYIDPGVYAYAFNSGFLGTMISMGRLPAKLDIQNVNLKTKENTISSSLSIYNLSSAILEYIYSNKSQENTVDRFLLTTNYLQLYIKDGKLQIILACNDFEDDDFASLLLINISKNIKQKEVLTIAGLLLSKEWDKIDKFLLNNKKVNNLYKISKKSYTNFKK